MNKMTTVREMLETLPPPYKDEALAEAARQGRAVDMSQAVTVHDAIARAFDWSRSAKGHDWWQRVYTTALEGRALKEPEEPAPSSTLDGVIRERTGPLASMSAALRADALAKVVADMRSPERLAAVSSAEAILGMPLYSIPNQQASCYLITDDKVLGAYLRGRVTEEQLSRMACAQRVELNEKQTTEQDEQTDT